MTAVRAPDELALLAAIRANVDEDTPRLEYADYLDGLDTVSVKCDGIGCGYKCRPGYVATSTAKQALGFPPEVECKKCHATGFIPGVSSSDRAELIRLQCELARRMVPVEVRETPTQTLLTYDHGNDWDALRARESALIIAHVAKWRKGPVCEMCDGTGEIRESGDYGPFSSRCFDCFGTGDAGGGLRRILRYRASNSEVPAMCNELVRVTYRRGMKHVECHVCDVWERTPNADGSNEPVTPRPTLWARAVCTHHPDVVAFRLADLVPDFTFNMHLDKLVWGWWRNGFGRNESRLPSPIFEFLIARHQSLAIPVNEIICDTYATEEEARAVLANRLALWVHTFLP